MIRIHPEQSIDFVFSALNQQGIYCFLMHEEPASTRLFTHTLKNNGTYFTAEEVLSAWLEKTVEAQLSMDHRSDIFPRSLEENTYLAHFAWPSQELIGHLKRSLGVELKECSLEQIPSYKFSSKERQWMLKSIQLIIGSDKESIRVESVKESRETE